MFATMSLARRIERAEVELVAAFATASTRRIGAERVLNREIAGGIAVFVEAGCPFNKVAGLGFGGVPAEAELDVVERAFAAGGAAVRVEVSTLADPAVVCHLTRRGYELVGFENVLGLDLSGRETSAPADGNREVVVTLAGTGEGRMWLDAVTTGFLHPDTFDGPPSTETVDREALERVFGDTLLVEGVERYLARRNGAIAGGGSLRVSGNVALLCGTSTLPDQRRRGVQSALLAERLRLAADRGCDIAVVTTEPASRSQANVQRAGFALLYARAVLVQSRDRLDLQRRAVTGSV